MRELWRRFSSRERTLAAAAAAVLLALACRYGLAEPYLRYKERTEESIAREVLRIEKSRKRIARGPAVDERLSRMRSRYDELLNRLVPGETPSLAAARLQERIETLARNAGIETVTTQVLPGEKVGDFQRTSVRLTLRGATPALADFLAAVEYDPWWLTIQSLDIRGQYAPARAASGDISPLTVMVEIGAFMRQGTDLAQRRPQAQPQPSAQGGKPRPAGGPPASAPTKGPGVVPGLRMGTSQG